MRTIIRFIIGLLVFLTVSLIFVLVILPLVISNKEITMPNESSYEFRLPKKEIFVKTSKYKGGRFVIFFATDSLSLNNSKDSIEYKTGVYPRIIVNTTNIYVDANKYRINGVIQSIGKNHFNIIEIVSDSIFDSFFENNIQKYPYSFISIDTREYSIGVNQQIVKKGNIHGGW